MKKVNLFIGFFCLVLFFSLIEFSSSANYCSSEDQILFKLYNENNSHVASWNSLVYGDLNGDGKVLSSDALAISSHLLGDIEITDPIRLRLADVNLDGEITERDRDLIIKASVDLLDERLPIREGSADSIEYSYEVCYDQIFGVNYTGSNPHVCGNPIFYVNNSYNSHVSTSFDADYPNAICYGNLICEVKSSCGSGETFVASIYDTYNSHVSLNDIYENKICCTLNLDPVLNFANRNFEFLGEIEARDDIYLIGSSTGFGEGSSVTFNVYRDDLLVDNLIDTVSGSVEGGLAKASWEASDEYIGKTLYFKIDGLDAESNKALVLEPNDTPTTLSLDSPICGANYSVGEEVEIKVTAEDPDDIIYGNLTIHDENNDLVYSIDFTNGGLDTTYTLSEAGNYLVTAFAQTRQRFRDSASIMVIDLADTERTYVAACIDSPEDYTRIPSTTVEFDARNTKALYVENGEIVEAPIGDILFSWEFSDVTYYEGSGSLYYFFNKTFSRAGDNWAKLVASYP